MIIATTATIPAMNIIVFTTLAIVGVSSAVELPCAQLTPPCTVKSLHFCAFVMPLVKYNPHEVLATSSSLFFTVTITTYADGPEPRD